MKLLQTPVFPHIGGEKTHYSREKMAIFAEKHSNET